VLRDVPPIAEALERHFGATGQELIEMGRRGEISAEEFARAIQNASGTIQREFDENVVPGFGDAVQAMRDSLMMFVGDVVNASGAAERGSRAMMVLAENIHVGLATVAVPAAVLAFRSMQTAAVALFAVIRAHPFVAIASAVSALGAAFWSFRPSQEEVTSRFSDLNDEMERNLQLYRDLDPSARRLERALNEQRLEVSELENEMADAQVRLEMYRDRMEEAGGSANGYRGRIKDLEESIGDMEGSLAAKNAEMERTEELLHGLRNAASEAEEAVRGAAEATWEMAAAMAAMAGDLVGVTREDVAGVLRSIGEESEESAEKVQRLSNEAENLHEAFDDLLDLDFERRMQDEITASLKELEPWFHRNREAARGLREELDRIGEGIDPFAGVDPMGGVRADDAHEAFREQAEQTATFTQSAMVNAMGEFERAGMRAFDSLTDSSMNLRDVLKDLGQDLTRMLFQMGLQSAMASAGGGMGLPGFATGGSFTVGGSGGTDSQFVPIMATPGERVTVETPAQQRQSDRGGGGSSVNVSTQFDSQGLADVVTTAIRGPDGQQAIAQAITMNPRMFRRLFRGGAR